MLSYDHLNIEKKWQKKWKEEKTFAADNNSLKPKYYVLDMFPYPSGAGLHVGHPEGYTATDIISRLRRHQGYNVLHPMGWDAFGLPAENFAIKTGIHPKISTADNIANFTKQIQSLGFSYDWDREIDTTDPEYYKWSQWIFLQLYKNGLAYEKEMVMSWCPTCKIVAANEEVENGVHERCGNPVEKRQMRQWMLKITQYADRLLNDLDDLDWTDAIKEMQRNWIGKSEGAEVQFQIAERGESLTVYTTRPDTLFGCTYMVLAPEHELVSKITTEAQKDAVEAYVQSALQKSERERKQDEKEKTGVFTGAYAVNPVNGKLVPIWVADYVLAGYGTGAIMAVPAHDERDCEFAKKFGLEIVQVVAPTVATYLVIEKSLSAENIEKLKEFGVVSEKQNDADWGRFFEVLVPFQKEKIFLNFLKENLLPEPISGAKSFYADSIGTSNFVVFHGEIFHVIDEKTLEIFKNYGRSIGVKEDQLDISLDRVCFSETGIACNSDFLDGFSTEEAKQKMISWLEEKGIGSRQINFKLRDWVFTRQRYWGEPIPLVHCESCGIVPLPESELPLKLPETANYEPTESGESPLAAITDWVNTTCPCCGKPAKRETSTMPNWAGSSWYWLRFMDPKNKELPVGKDAEKYWQQVDLYVGGAEHAVLHLLYARFWHKFLFDIGVVTTKEPFQKLVNQGMILAFSYKNENGKYYHPNDVEEKNGKFYAKESGEPLERQIEKMSKSKLNVVNPDDVVEEYGADTLRMYEMFMGPFDQTVVWDTQGVVGIRRFLEKVAKLEEKVLEENVVIVHGFESNPSSHWIPELQNFLMQKGFVVQVPEMPSATAPKYEEWKKTLDALVINENTTLVGHSLGGGFLVRYLSDTGRKVKKIILVAPTNTKLLPGIDQEFSKMFDAEKVKSVCEEIVLIHSEADVYISQDQFKNYEEVLNAKTLLVQGGEHLSSSQKEKARDVLFKTFSDSAQLEKLLHKTIKKVTENTEDFKFNTAISGMMVFVNEALKSENISKNIFETFLLLLHPYAPHLAEELFEKQGNKNSLDFLAWPEWNEELCKDDEVTIAVQVNGKLRDTIPVASDATKEEVLALAKASKKVQNYLVGEIKKEIYVPGKLVSFVV